MKQIKNKFNLNKLEKFNNIILYFLLPVLLLFTEDILLDGVSLLSMILLGASFLLLLAHVFHGQVRFGQLFRLDYYRRNPIILIAVWSFLSALGVLFFGEAAFKYSGCFFGLSLALIFLFSSSKTGSLRLDTILDIICYAGLIMAMCLLIYYLTYFEMDFLVGAILANRSELSAYIMLWLMAAAFRYITVRDRIKSWIYLFMSIVGFFILAFNHYVPGFWIMIIFYLLMPIMLKPTAEVARRMAILLGCFLMVISNYVLLHDYTDLGQLPHLEISTYTVQHSIYVELLLALGALVFFGCWDKIPEDADKEQVIMSELRKRLVYIIMLAAAAFIILTLGGDFWEDLSESTPKDVVMGFLTPLLTDIKEYEGGIYSLIEGQGIPFTILTVGVGIWYLYNLLRDSSSNMPNASKSAIVCIVFALQILLGGINMQTAAVYIILISLGTQPTTEIEPMKGASEPQK